MKTAKIIILDEYRNGRSARKSGNGFLVVNGCGAQDTAMLWNMMAHNYKIWPGAGEHATGEETTPENGRKIF